MAISAAIPTVSPINFSGKKEEFERFSVLDVDFIIEINTALLGTLVAHHWLISINIGIYGKIFIRHIN